MESLADTVKSSVAALIGCRPVVFIDYPLHTNGGDLAIWQGTEEFFEQSGTQVVARFSVHELCTGDPSRGNFRLKKTIALVDKAVESGAMLVFQGGGNFGDLYPVHHEFRRIILQRYGDAPALVLPQSIHYGCPERRSRDQDSFSAHRNLTLLVRDGGAASFAREAGINHHVVPDMAHMLWPRTTRYRARRGQGVLYFLRRDKERLHVSRAPALDWQDISGPALEMAVPCFMKLQKHQRWPISFVPTAGLWRTAASVRLHFGALRFFSAHEVVVTDRLHGMIMSALLGRFIWVRDNSYGKLGSYYRTWLAGSDRITLH